jgi:ADP-glucose pyrophosphorylase
MNKRHYYLKIHTQNPLKKHKIIISTKDVSVMRYVIEQVRKKENRQMHTVICLEIDYELVTLFDAMQANNSTEIIKSKEKLRSLVKKLNDLPKV